MAQFPVDCSSPRLATESFIENLQPGRSFPAEAARCFDFSRFDGSDSQKERLVAQLKSVVDARGLYVYYDRIPDDANFMSPEDKQHRVVLFPRQLPVVSLNKIEDRWLFTPQTISATPMLYDETFVMNLEGMSLKLPSVFQTSVMGAKLWQWSALLCVLILAILLARILQALSSTVLGRLLKKRKFNWLEQAREKTAWPITTLFTTGIMAPFLQEMNLPVHFSLVVVIALKVVATGSIIVISYRFIDTLAAYMSDKASKTHTRLDDQLVPLVRKSLKVVLTVFGVIFVLQNLQVDVGSLLAGLGIGGLAFALAAKDTLANFFGSFMIFVDRPFQIGDWVKMAGVEGTVEEVGFRSTRVRTFYSSVITVPNSKVAGAVIDNLGERNFRRLKMTVGLTYDTPPQKVQAFVEGVRAVLDANPGIYAQPSNVYFYNMGESALEVLIYTFLDVADWSQELKQRHNILLELMRLADALGVSFAFPTHTIHLDSTPENPLEPHEDQSPEALGALVTGFGPGGDRGLPEGMALTSFFDGHETKRGDAGE
jgi:MscS family membrane protein